MTAPAPRLSPLRLMARLAVLPLALLVGFSLAFPVAAAGGIVEELATAALREGKVTRTYTRELLAVTLSAA